MFRRGQTFICLICALRAAEVQALNWHGKSIKMRKVRDQVTLPFAGCESDA